MNQQQVLIYSLLVSLAWGIQGYLDPMSANLKMNRILLIFSSIVIGIISVFVSVRDKITWKDEITEIKNLSNKDGLKLLLILFSDLIFGLIASILYNKIFLEPTNEIIIVVLTSTYPVITYLISLLVEKKELNMKILIGLISIIIGTIIMLT